MMRICDWIVVGKIPPLCLLCTFHRVIDTLWEARHVCTVHNCDTRPDAVCAIFSTKEEK